jgi:hypothetical protein
MWGGGAAVADDDMSEPSGPNPLAVAWSIMRAMRSRRPAPSGTGSTDHSRLAPVLDALRRHGVTALTERRDDLDDYRTHLETIDPDTLTGDEALAFWLNLYNAGALTVAAEAAARGESSVLRLPGAFRRPWTHIAGEDLSLDAIEHGKIRRFGDPRIHGALVCGSASCPTLRHEPYRGAALDQQLDDQLRSFLAAGGAVADREARVLKLSRVFMWYGGDFARPHRMPTWLPPRRRNLAATLSRWLDGTITRWVEDTEPRVEFLAYDWSLACSIG